MPTKGYSENIDFEIFCKAKIDIQDVSDKAKMKEKYPDVDKSQDDGVIT